MMEVPTQEELANMKGTTESLMKTDILRTVKGCSLPIESMSRSELLQAYEDCWGVKYPEDDVLWGE